MPALDKQDHRAKEANDNGPKAKTSKQNRIYLAVPFEENQKAKELGARWDREASSWYAPSAKVAEKTKQWSVEGKAPAAEEKRDPVQEFSDWMRAQGMDLKGHAIMDGKWHRIAIMGEKAKNASYRGHLDAAVPNGMLNNFKGTKSEWKFDGVKLSKDEVAKAIEAGKKAQKERADELKQDQEKAAKTAFGIWSNLTKWAEPENCDYLKRKDVRGYGVKLDKDGRMVVPLRDTDLRIHSLQFVGEEKHYLKNGRKEGLFHAIDPKRYLSDKDKPGLGDTIVFAEGYATGASVHKFVRKPTIITFDGGNLVKVAKAMREKFPDVTMLFAADDDHHLPLREIPLANMGQEMAREAADAVGGYVVSPPLTKAEKAKGLTDWNDLEKERGTDKAAFQFLMQTRKSLDAEKIKEQELSCSPKKEMSRDLEVV
ncbi:Uncharacterized domain associated with phage/plasmid primase [Pseudovibrio denitrificans]|uniref:Uncharacterized domain associated with phage/plasmid primase n=1 Tax=Pseudovibrio denitrificans TaxID=258256 RepID=A0A1I7DVH1_9HYPH|nr:DUF5710 domain-containing protein [Pseudovibrio denitrificans]SFU15654.1 Uncharacterized domain associated with phage/plasmid primase [Pseudovibrio denitrificans]